MEISIREKEFVVIRELNLKANKIRRDIVEMIRKKKSGYPGGILNGERHFEVENQGLFDWYCDWRCVGYAG